MKLVTLIQQLETLSLSLRVGEEDETSLRTALTPIDLFFFSISYNPTFLTCCVSGRRLFSF